MATYQIDSTDQSTENLTVDYVNERGGVQSIAGQMYQAIARCEAAYAAFDTSLQVGQPFADLAVYHTAKQTPIADAVTLLRSQMAGVMALMVTMESAFPAGQQLFPGVPKE